MGVTPTPPPRSREEMEIRALRRKITATLQAAGIEPGQGGQTKPPPDRQNILDDEGFVIGLVEGSPFPPPDPRLRHYAGGSEHVTFRYDEIDDGPLSKGGIVSRETFPRDWRDRLAKWWLTRAHALRSGWVIHPLSVKLPGENPVKPSREMPVHHFLWWWFDAVAWKWLLKRGGTKAFDPPEVRISHE